MTLSILVAGLVTGSIYGLLALGYHLTFIVSRTVNFSQGASLMVGAVLLYQTNVVWGLSAWLAVPLVLGVCALFGLLIERFAVRPFAGGGAAGGMSGGGEPIAWLMSTIALGIVVENAARLSFGKESRSLPSVLAASPMRVMGAGIYPIEILIPLAGGLIALGLWWLSRRSLAGRALLAAAQNREAAALQGIDVQRLIQLTYALSTALAGLAGILVAPKLNVAAGMGTMFGLKAFAAAIIGGIGSAPGCLIAGLGYGLLEALIAATLPSAWRDILGFALVIVVLAIRPVGLFGHARIEKV